MKIPQKTILVPVAAGTFCTLLGCGIIFELINFETKVDAMQISGQL